MFYFLSAAELRSGKFDTMPDFKDATQKEWIKQHTIKLKELPKEQVSKYLAVCDMWETQGETQE